MECQSFEVHGLLKSLAKKFLKNFIASMTANNNDTCLRVSSFYSSSEILVELRISNFFMQT